GKLLVRDDGRDHREGGVDHAVDDRLEQGLLGVEIVVEGAARRLELVEHVLDAHLLVTAALHQPLGCFDEGLATHRVHGQVQGSRHARSITNRQSVYYFPQLISLLPIHGEVARSAGGAGGTGRGGPPNNGEALSSTYMGRWLEAPEGMVAHGGADDRYTDRYPS